MAVNTKPIVLRGFMYMERGQWMKLTMQIESRLTTE